MAPRSNKRPRDEKKRIPVLKHATDELFQHSFQKYKVVHLPSVFRNGISTTCNEKSTEMLSWDDLKDTFTELNEDDKKSWCIENGNNKNGKETITSPTDFLDPKQEKHENGYAYCSFLIQHEKKVKEKVLSRAPLSTLPFGSKWDYGPSIWVFFGRNKSSKRDLQGRPEHTDSVSHDGTWHYQLSGTKTWYLRPTKKLLDHMKSNGVNDFSESDVIQVDCNKGDVLIVNTALWWHQTVIPCQPNPSVSYARDFFMEDNKQRNNDESADGGMTNVDGLYASNDIEQGTVIFTENGTLCRERSENVL
jgi:hypothetical protein